MEPPGTTARAQATRLLGEMGLGGLAPTLSRQPLNGRPRDDRAARLRARRAFLRRVAGQPAQVSASPDPLADRAATLAALKRLAAVHTAALPSSFFPAVTATESCAGHGVCVASCTTGALRWFEGNGLRGVEFDAERCTACGDCVERCPEQALTLKANGNGTVPTATLRLSAHALRVCERCEDEFTADGDDALCLGCRKDIGLFNDLATAGRGGATEDEEIKTEVTT